MQLIIMPAPKRPTNEPPSITNGDLSTLLMQLIQAQIQGAQAIQRLLHRIHRPGA